jgi:GNAT superfamily N-acetyltransferase
MSSFRLRSASPADAAAVADVVVALETALYGGTAYTQSDLEDEWARLDLERFARVAVDGERIVGYGSAHERGELWRTEVFVHPDAQGRGAGTLLADALEREAAGGGARRVQGNVYEEDAAGHRLLEALGYRPVRTFREMRIELDAAPAHPVWPDGLRADAFDPDRDAPEFHAAHQEAFADHWEYVYRDFAKWRDWHIESEKFDPSLWCVVRDGGEIAAGAISVADLYGGGWVASLFTRRPWRGRGVGGALLHDAFARFWDRGERSVGLGVDAEGDTGAFRVYERAGMKPVLGWVMYEKDVRGAA